MLRHELLEVAVCLHAALAGEERDDVSILAERLVPQAKLVLTQLDAARQAKASAEHETQRVQAELAKCEKKLELYKRQVQVVAADEEALRAAVREAQEQRDAASRAVAEREELRASLGGAIEQLASERTIAVQRATVAEAALQADGPSPGSGVRVDLPAGATHGVGLGSRPLQPADTCASAAQSKPRLVGCRSHIDASCPRL